MNSTAQQLGEEPLPQHWEMRIDNRTGLPYYLNHLDKYTTWDDPRLVSQPRSMLNNMNFKLTPEPQRRFRQASVEPSSSADRYYSMPSRQDNFYSLPRRPNNRFTNQPAFRDPFMEDFFNNKFGFHDDYDNFFEQSWPNKFHTIQRTQQPRARSMQPPTRREPPQQTQSVDDCQTRTIPIRRQPAQDPRYEGEHVIIPTQFKRKQESRNPPEPKQQPPSEPAAPRSGKTSPQPTCDDSNEDSILQRMNSVNNEQESDVYTGSDAVDQTDGDSSQMCTETTIPIIVTSSASQEPKTSTTLPTIVIEEHQDTDGSFQNVPDESQRPPASRPSSPKDQHSSNKTSSETDTTEQEINNGEEPMAEAEEADSVEEDAEQKKAIQESYSQIEKIREEVDEFKGQVEEYTGEKNTKEYRTLEEMLTRCQLALDNVDTHGDLEVRKRRKETVNYIESILTKLESKTHK